MRLYPTDDKCREILTRLRWPEGVTCLRCKERRVAWLKARNQFECMSCGYQFSVTTGTIFNDTHLPLLKWFMTVLLLCESKKGMSACQIQRTLGISYKTAWYLCHRIRAAMLETEKEMLDGIVEIDETYVGGKARRHLPKSKKEVVIGIRKRGGDLRLIRASEATAKEIRRIVGDNVSEDVEVIVTDESAIYPFGLTSKHRKVHKTICHQKEYVSGDVHTNTVESAFSLLKRGIIGTWHKVSAKHLSSYLNEMMFRFNRRRNPNLFVDTLRHMVTTPVLTFERLTA
jgi:transposase-like protein